MMTNDPSGPCKKDSWRFFDRAIENICLAATRMAIAAMVIIAASISPVEPKALLIWLRIL